MIKQECKQYRFKKQLHSNNLKLNQQSIWDIITIHRILLSHQLVQQPRSNPKILNRLVLIQMK